tara:strand:- start:161 stop:1033 length:873 start_codon:yes stop_codon:yes gene_type:complete
MIYISTGGFKFNTCFESIDKLTKKGIKQIELSGGKFIDNQISELKIIKKNNKNISFQVHNYFPPPKKSFVFNLGSLDDEVANKSMNHAINSIKLASVLGGKYYSFHGGFLLDPKVEELGKKIKKTPLFERESSKQKFIERVNFLSEIALREKVTLLIENNVLSHNNLKEFGSNILLMVETEECLEVMQKVNSNVKMLIDVAHLKVSSNSLNFKKELFLQYLDNWIAAYHLSDNNGLKDSNEKITKDSWFWPYLKNDLDYYSIEVYNITIDELIEQRNLAKKMLQKNIFPK